MDIISEGHVGFRVDLWHNYSEQILSIFLDQIAMLLYITQKMLYITHFYREKFAYIKKKQYLCSGFKNHIDMTEVTVSSFQGFGHRVQLVRRQAVARQWALVDNRRVLVATKDEDTSKGAFINHVASIVRQRESAL